jgi:hypothetical protein
MEDATDKTGAGFVAEPSTGDPVTHSHTADREAEMNARWLREIDAHNVEFVILDPYGDSDLVEIFRHQPAWAVDFEDEEAVIFAHAAFG